ncbi:hypothetical protein SDC9_156408 [bioreactor metagenome]|uniref:Uncharacterized protein n=1 Tax=bioreactor metagenome TaxID=1076179 RepID=A0A645F5H0_9ZZZZ
MLGLGDQLLAAQRERILLLARNAVALGDDVSRLYHRHVHGWLVAHQPFILVLGDLFGRAHHAARAGHALHTTCHGNIHPVGENAPRRLGDGLKARRAKAIDGGAAYRHGQTRTHRSQTRDVTAITSVRVGTAQHHVVHQAAVHPGALDGGGDGQGAQLRAGQKIEFTAQGLGERRTGVGNDDCFTHDFFSVKGLMGRARAHGQRQTGRR